MIAVALALACAAVDFASQDIPALRVTPSRALTGEPSINALQVDLDGDGHMDLLFADGVALQRDGGFPPDARYPLPASPPGAEADMWGLHLYIRHVEGMSVHRLRDGSWDEMAAYAVAWPHSGALESVPWRRADPSAGRIEARRFLHDTDGDGVPEVVVVDEAGLHVFRLTDGNYVPDPPRDILPPLTLAPAQPQPVWPAAARRVAVPTRHMACRLNLDGADLLRLTQETAPDGRIVYHSDRFADRLRAGAHGAEPVRESSAPLPGHMRPQRLGARDAGLFAGIRWETATAAPMPVPLLEIWVTLDAGQTLRRERMRLPQGYQPAAVFADVDGDGRPDLIVEESGLFDGGMREAALRYQTQTTLRHRVRVYPGNAGGFADTPTLDHEARIRLDAPPGRHGRLFRNYQAGGLINLTGDFDGDGLRDLAVRDQPDRIAIHLQRDGRFANSPDAVITLQYDTPFFVADINGDGRDDVMMLWADPEATRPESITRVHFSVKARP